MRCVSCAANTYADTSGATACLQCPEGLLSATGSSSEFDCSYDPGKRLLNVFVHVPTDDEMANIHMQKNLNALWAISLAQR